MIRKLVYRQPAIDAMIELKRKGKTQHIRVIRSRSLSLQNRAEEQANVKQIHSNPDIYETFISGLELEGMVPPEGYRILFLLTTKNIVVLSIYADRR